MTVHKRLQVALNGLRWSALAAAIGVCSGLASGLFLILLEAVTDFRLGHSWLLPLLPLGGLLVGSMYHYFGKSVEAGNNLVIDEFHRLNKVIPLRMAPLVLTCTLLTHLFGGSAGREGTAVQMGASIADQFTYLFNVEKSHRRILLMAGMSGGFGSVFGVPFAGMAFGLEVVFVGNLQVWSLLPCAVSAFVAHYTTLALGVHHTAYSAPVLPSLGFLTFALLVIAGIVFGLVARLFALLTESVSKSSKRIIKFLPARALVGGLILAALYGAIPALVRYSGLGVPVIVAALKEPVLVYDWFGKLAMTALTLGLGFKGGEVTPLLFVGATLGNAMAAYLPLSVGLLGAVGLVGVFAGAANTPVACTIMAMELFGVDIFPYALIVCVASYLASGHRGIYHAQRIHTRKDQLPRRAFAFVKGLFAPRPFKEKD